MSQERDAVSTPVEIARMTIREYVINGRIPTVEEVPRFESGMAGCFVSLHSGGALRGCIGTIFPTKESIAAEIIRNSVSACSEDPRFDPVDSSELDGLEINVDVLNPPAPVESRKDLDPRLYGVIVTSGIRRGLLLPDLDGVDTVEDQLAIACRKAGIHPSERYEIQRFTVTRYR